MTDFPRKLRIGVIGLGLAGGIMVPVIVAHPRLNLVAAADPNPLLRKRFADDLGLPTFVDAEALLDSGLVDAVYIATPHRLHCEQVISAARRGKHVVVEKPMALDLVSCDQMNDAVQRNGVVLIVGHTHSFDPAIGVMRDYSVQRTLGAISMLAMWNYTDFLWLC